jgi:hypothetical protein
MLRASQPRVYHAARQKSASTPSPTHSLAPIRDFVLCWPNLGVLTLIGSMHRLTARLLLFIALVGNLAPLALAATSAPPHACCVRKAAHHCHDSAVSESNQFVIRDASCCDHDCCRAAISAQWSHPQSRAAAFFLQTIDAGVAGIHADSPANASAEFQSTRAPPAC